MSAVFSKKLLSILVAVAMVMACMLICTGCTEPSDYSGTKAEEEIKTIVYKDKAIAALVSNIFSKPASDVTASELASIRYFALSYYDGTYNASIGFDDYMEAVESKKDNSYDLLVKTTTSNPASFEDMKYFTGLRSFNLFNVYTFSDFSHLKNCRELEALSIHTDAKNTAIKKLDGVEKIKSLKEFGLYGAIITDLSPLAGLTELTSLSIGADYRMYEEDDKNFYDIKALENLDKLESLSISFSGVSDLSPIADAPLKYLSVYRSGLSDISALESIKTLEEVSLTYNAIEDITPLTKLPELKVIILDYNYITDVSPFAALDADKVTFVSMDMNSVEDWSSVRELYEAGKLYTGYDLYFED